MPQRTFRKVLGSFQKRRRFCKLISLSDGLGPLSTTIAWCGSKRKMRDSFARDDLLDPARPTANQLSDFKTLNAALLLLSSTSCDKRRYCRTLRFKGATLSAGKVTTTTHCSSLPAGNIDWSTYPGETGRAEQVACPRKSTDRRRREPDHLHCLLQTLEAGFILFGRLDSTVPYS